jgi:uncharacterized integral membrane protein
MLAVAILVMAFEDNTSSSVGWLFWVSFYGIGLAITYVTVGLARKRSKFAHAIVGSIGLAFLSASLVLGSFLPYAFEIGSHTVDSFAENYEGSWEELLTVVLLGSATVGALLGGLCGLLRALFDEAAEKAASVSAGVRPGPPAQGAASRASTPKQSP